MCSEHSASQAALPSRPGTDLKGEFVIVADGLAKTYRIFSSPSARLWQMFVGGRRQFFSSFDALKPITFRIAAGECVGIVGRNGSGKSTLLQLLAGTLTASAGEMRVEGRVAALLELGAGFSPEFSGRENVYLYSAILGVSKERVDALFPQIAEFAGIGDFMDRPLTTYSSGMVVRLAFAVATAVRPDVLIVDEALAVGDEAFQRKCFARLEKMRGEGATILFVSHSAQTVIQLCDRALWLEQGQLQIDGEPKAVIDAYHRAILGSSSQSGRPPHVAPKSEMTELAFSEALVEYPSEGGRIVSASLAALTGQCVSSLEHGERYRFSYRLQLDRPAAGLRCGMLIKTRTGVEVAGAVLPLVERGVASHEAGDTIDVTFEFDCLLYPGRYFLNCGVMAERDGEQHYVHRLVDAFEFDVVNPLRRNRYGISPEGLVDLDFRAEISTASTPE